MTTIDSVYTQRNELAVAFAKAALAAGWKAGRGIDSKADPEWANVVYVDLPDGRQVSWHISPDCVPLLDGLPQYVGTWDGTFIGRETGWSRGIEVVAQQKDPTDPGNDVDVLREHVRHLERRIRELHAQQAEPLNLSDRAVQRRLASQWGYVPTRPEALRLADAIDPFVRPYAPDHLTSKVAAAELRRLHAENEALQNTKHYEAPPGFVVNPDYLVPELRAQRDALLELLKLARSIIGHPDDAHTQMIDAAIKAAEEAPHGIGQR